MKQTTKILIGISILFLLVPNVNVAKAQTESVNRDDVLWCAGYWAPPAHWNPVGWGGGESWGAFFMYLPLFGYNYQLNQLIPLIGETMEWNEDGSELHIKLRDEAQWSDGVNITSQDVYWNFVLLYDPGQWSGAFGNRVDNFVIVDEKNFYLEMNPNYHYSRDVWFRFAGGARLLPPHIWDAIAIERGGWPINGSGPDNSIGQVGNQDFTNDWLDPEFPEEWKVCSGPYVPYFVSETRDKQMYKKVDSWWGDGVLTDNFDKMPGYIGQLHYASNFAMNAAFAADQIDWYGGYYPRIWELMESNPNIHAWTDNPPYFPPQSAMIELAPNHLRYPFDQKWLRQVFAWAINYNDLSQVSASGYLQKARIGWVDDRSPTQDDFYNTTIEETYGVSFDPSQATDILDDYCFKYNGIWYTKNSTDRLGDLGAGEVPVADQLPDIPDDPSTPDVDESVWSKEVNVRIGGWDIQVISGWSDSMMQASLISTYLGDIGIDASPKYVDYSAFVSSNVGEGNGDYDLMIFGLGFAPNDEIYQGLNKIAGPYNVWTNVTGWYRPDFNQTVRQLEITAQGSQEEMNLVNQAQLMLAQDIPSIPIAPNGYWYAFNTKYWSGWPNEVYPYIQPIAPWAVNRAGGMLYLLMHMSPTNEQTSDDSNGGGGIASFSMGFLLLSALGALSIVIYRVKKRK